MWLPLLLVAPALAADRALSVDELGVALDLGGGVDRGAQAALGLGLARASLWGSTTTRGLWMGGSVGGELYGWSSGATWDIGRAELRVESRGRVGGLAVARVEASVVEQWSASTAPVGLSLRKGASQGWVALGPCLRAEGDHRHLGLTGEVNLQHRTAGDADLGLRADVHHQEGDLAAWVFEPSAWSGVPVGPVRWTSGLGLMAAAGEGPGQWRGGLPPGGYRGLRLRTGLVTSLGPTLQGFGEAGVDYAGDTRVFGGVGLRILATRSALRGELVAQAEDIELSITAPGAGQVEVVGSFSGWEPIALRPVGEGRWSTGPLRLQSGVYTYVFLVDGLPTLPSEVTHREPDGLGGENGVLLVDGLPSTLAPPPSPGPAGAPPR